MRLIDASKPSTDEVIHRTLLYGEAVSGKTYSLRTIPEKYRPILVIDIDEKSESLYGQEGITLARVDRYEENERTKKVSPVMYLQAKKILQDAELLSQHKTIVIDSMTLLYAAIMERVRSNNSREEMDATTQPDFGVALNLTLNLTYLLMETRKNLVLICHEDKTALTTGVSKGTPALTGQLGILIPRYYGDIIHAVSRNGAKGPEWVWETRSKQFVAGTPKTTEAEIEPNFGRLWK